ncbi:MAG: 30S ribosomal protein S24e [Candidatus Diapherotrites archaeon]
MELKIEQQEKQPLLNRSEIRFSIDDSAKTPSRLEVQEKIAAQLNVPQNLVVVKTVLQRFGTKSVSGFAHIYTDEATLKKIEVKHKIFKNLKEKPKADVAPTPPAPAPHAPKEEKAKAEKKKEGK